MKNAVEGQPLQFLNQKLIDLINKENRFAGE